MSNYGKEGDQFSYEMFKRMLSEENIFTITRPDMYEIVTRDKFEHYYSAEYW